MKNPTKFRALKNRYNGDVPLREDYEIVSSNRVTGWSVNFPIVATCKPTKVCAMTCYGLSGPITLNASLAKHARNHPWCKATPENFRAQLILPPKSNPEQFIYDTVLFLYSGFFGFGPRKRRQ